MASPAVAKPLQGKTAIVTGANSGIGTSRSAGCAAAAPACVVLRSLGFACSPGAFARRFPPGFETAAELAARGAAVVLACRRVDAAETAAAAIRCALGRAFALAARS
jgi:NAD(P)-dependent dehydrogenase (short-subunit alcohol dehydrogenase family)